MVSLAVDRGAPADSLQVDDEDGEGMEVSPSYIDYMAGYLPEPPPSWAPPSPYSQCAPSPHVGGLPPQQSHGRQSLSQLDVGALPTYEEAMRVQPMKTEFSNSNSA